MHKKSENIPVNRLPIGIREGIFIARTTCNGVPHTKEVERSHRDNGHLFIIQEKGSTLIEIDFQQHDIHAPAVLYIHPDQVHRLITFENATTCSWIITSENLHPEYLKLLEAMAPVSALALNTETLAMISETASLCIGFSQRKHEKLYDFILKESCNTLVVLIASQYLAQSKTMDHLSRFEIITKSFKSVLGHHFSTVKSPKEYAKFLNISTPYLNECVKRTTGSSVSYHIQHRVVLEAKRLICYSNKSVKEIAAELGYDDYSYFSRLFVKITGLTPLTFRTKNLD